MYLHLGQNVTVMTKDVIGIFDLDTTTVSRVTRDYLTKAERDKDVINVSEELPKSFIICRAPERKSGRVVYISQISSATLLRRAVSFE